jgi:dipeptidyl aminopeptidase/acylaminoacyl peptidase
MLLLSGFALGGVLARPMRAWTGDGGEEPRPTRRLRLHGKDLDCIEALAFSADRAILATAHSDGVLYLWDLGTGQERHRLGGQPGDVGFLAFAGHDRTVVFRTANGTARTWEPLTGVTRTVLARDKVSRHGMTATDVSADGRLLATVHKGGGCDTLVQVRDLASGREVFRFNNADGHEEVYALAFAPDGRSLALGDQAGAVTLLECAKGKPRLRLDERTGPVGSLAWSADGKVLAVGVVRRSRRVAIAVWNVAQLQREGELTGFADAVDDLFFSPDGRSLATSESGRGRFTVWAPTTGRRRTTVRIRGYRGGAFLADRRTLAVVREQSRLHEVVFFDVERSDPGKPK